MFVDGQLIYMKDWDHKSVLWFEVSGHPPRLLPLDSNNPMGDRINGQKRGKRRKRRRRQRRQRRKRLKCLDWRSSALSIRLAEFYLLLDNPAVASEVTLSTPGSDPMPVLQHPNASSHGRWSDRTAPMERRARDYREPL